MVQAGVGIGAAANPLGAKAILCHDEAGGQGDPFFWHRIDLSIPFFFFTQDGSNIERRCSLVLSMCYTPHVFRT